MTDYAAKYIDVGAAIEQRSRIGGPILNQHGEVVDFICLVCGTSFASHADYENDCELVIQAAALLDV